MTALVPELYVTDLETSLRFYRTLLGFEIEYQRPEERFVYLKRGAAALMIEEPVGRTWLAAPLEHPFGRGVSFQVMVENLTELHQTCVDAHAKIFVSLETRNYRRRDEMVSQTQFVVQDPDGYLIRLAQIPPSDENEID